jgi:hypothetical protein
MVDGLELRRLDPEADEGLIREACDWLDAQPLYFKNADAAWGREDADTYLRLMRERPQIDHGVFLNGRMVAVITVTMEGLGVYNSHLMVKRGSDPLAIAQAGAWVFEQLRERGMREGWAWLASKNWGARRVLELIGLRQDGVEQIKGQSHGQPIHWLRYSVRCV